MNDTVSALYVMPNGPYPSLVEDWWDGSEGRDAREYDGPNPVVAHPPCARWSMFWWAARHKGLGLGDDEGCFAAAIEATRKWGGVLEHPQSTHAWPRFDILRPVVGRWARSLFRPDEWVAQVDQLAYGHKARKRTWLVFVGDNPPALDWRQAAPPRAGETRHYLRRPRAWASTDRPRAELAKMGIMMLTKRELSVSPMPFATMLVSLAQRCV